MKNIDELRKLSVSQVVDRENGYGAVSTAIRPLSDDMVVCGRAVTVWTVAGNIGYVDALLDAVGEGDVVVVDAGGEEDVASFDSSLLVALKEKGVCGVIVDGSVSYHEDGILPVFARSVHPRAVQRTGFYRVGKSVSLGGTSVSSGDVVYGTGDGIVIIPESEIEAI